MAAAPAFPASRAASLLFLSGMASVVFETLWVKQLGLVVGVDVHAVTVALSAFFAGLGAGAIVLGRQVDRASHPARLYAVLEVAAGALGALATLFLAASPEPFVRLQAAAGPLAYLLPFALVSLPAVAMGGTLPALVRAVAPNAGSLSERSGLLYAANTAGAVAGAVATPFLFIPAFGVRGTGLAAAAIDLFAAALAWGAARDLASLRSAVSASAPQAADRRLALVLYAVAGGIALGYQIVWSQAVVPFLSTRTAAFAVLVATYLTGLALGSALWAGWADRVEQPWRAFGLLIAGAGFAALAGLATAGVWLFPLQAAAGAWAFRATGSDLADMCARFAVPCAVIVLPSTLLLGAAFPAALRVARGGAHVGRHVGGVLAWNTAGGIAGTLVTGFLLIPALGIVRAMGVLVVLAALVGALALAQHAVGERRSLIPSIGLVIAALAGGLAVPVDAVARFVAASRGGALLFRGESAGGSVVVLEQEAARGTFRRLYVDGVSNSGDAMTSLRYMRLQALLPLLVHRDEPRSALVIGLGTGITAGALLAEPGLERRVAVELLPAVAKATPLFHGNFGAGSDPRLEVRIGDGRHALLRDAATWDLITLEPPPPSAAGVVNLYSRDFYELCRRRLAPGGMLAQWWPLPTQNDEASRSLVRAFLDAFPHASLWTTELHEMLLVGSAERVELDAARIRERFARLPTAEALAEVGIASPEALLATWVTERTGLERYAAGAPPITDDRPLIEHVAWVRPGEFERVLPQLLALASEPPIRGDAPFVSGVAAERRRLFRFYEGSLAAYGHDQEAWAAAMREVLAQDPANPYYRWFVGPVSRQ